MTSQCKSGFGKLKCIRIAMGTVLSVKRGLKLPRYKAAGRIERERVSAPLGRNWEGRAGCMLAKAILPKAASPVSWRWHAVKAMHPNSGDLAASTNMLREELSKVADSITVRERDRNGLQGVGGVHSTRESGDSITPEKGRGSACLHGHANAMKNSIPFGVRGYEKA